MTSPTPPPRAVIFDLGGTLVDWPDWDETSLLHWGSAYDFLAHRAGKTRPLPARGDFVDAMRAAEAAHWERVVAERWSGPPSGLVAAGFRQLGIHRAEEDIVHVLDGYARAVDGWATLVPDAVETLQTLRARGYPLGLLSNTWWAADWHNADLAAHGLAPLLDEIAYTSDLPHSKPHPSVFLEVAQRLGVDPAACVMVGDRLADDIRGALGVGMRGIWIENDRPWPRPEDVRPTATIRGLAEIPPLLRAWGEHRARRGARAEPRR